ncbi:hypothetical protein BD560DRAFT_409238 [Blakeslea trispora]|nr:hypothetical protein BD560DRAFT_409238 [Blakeslea trispora]
MINSSSNITSTTYCQDESLDIELATEIGQGLLSEIKRMQLILQQKEKRIDELEAERKAHHESMEDLTRQLRLKVETEEQLKEELHQSELAKQRLSHQIRQLSQSLSKTQMEQIRRERQETLIQQELKHLKTAQTKWQEAQNEYEDRLTLLNDSIAKLEKEKDLIISSSEDSEEESEEIEEPINDTSSQKVKVTAAQITTPASDVSNSSRHVIKPYIAAISPSIISSSSLTSPLTPRELSFVDERLPSRTEPEEHDLRAVRPSKETDQSSMTGSEGLDLSLSYIIHTMTGEKAYKLSEGHFKWYAASKRQTRFFWIHPYTKTLYWSKCESGLQNNVHKAKSVHIDAFSVELNKSLPVITIYSAAQIVKLQCTTMESHDLWVQALRYFVLEKRDSKRKASYGR